MSLRSAILLGALVLAPSTGHSQSVTSAARRALPLKRRPQPTTTAITANDLMSRLYAFADDSMMGREAGSLGAMKGTAYIAAEARRLGLVPAGDGGGYFQNMPFVARTLDPQSSISVNGAPLTPYRDFVVLPFRGALPRALDGARVIYGGVQGDTAHSITADQAEGKLVVVRNPTGALVRIGPTSRFARAAAVALVGDADLTASTLASGRASSLTLPPASGAASVVSCCR